MPPERFNIDGFYHPDGSRAGVMDADGGYFLDEDVRLFDNAFFGINAMEATYMDPQQRKLLEVVYECFESTGLSMSDVSGTNVGVFVGNFTVDYQTMQTRDPDYMHRYNATGSGTAICRCSSRKIGDVAQANTIGSIEPYQSCIQSAGTKVRGYSNIQPPKLQTHMMSQHDDRYGLFIFNLLLT